MRGSVESGPLKELRRQLESLTGTLGSSDTLGDLSPNAAAAAAAAAAAVEAALEGGGHGGDKSTRVERLLQAGMLHAKAQLAYTHVHMQHRV
jgi:hypothetical protein